MKPMSTRVKILLGNAAGIFLVLIAFGAASRVVVKKVGIDGLDKQLEGASRPFLNPPPGMGGMNGPRFGGPGPNQPDSNGQGPNGPDSIGQGPYPSGQRAAMPGDSGGNPDLLDQPQLGPNRRPPPATDGVANLGGPQQDLDIKDLPVDEAAIQQAKDNGTAFVTQELNGQKLRVIYVSAPAGRQVRAGRAAVPMQPVNDEIQLIDLTFLLLLVPALLISLGISSVLTKWTLMPAAKMAGEAQKIDANRLEKRLPVIGTDEFGALAQTFNGMLEKVEAGYQAQADALEAQKRFTGDAAHELKSPLTVISGNVQLGLESAGDEKTRECLTEIQRESAAMSAIVQDLLLLSRLESDQPLNLIDIPAVELFESASAGISAEFKSRILLVTEPTDLTVRGDQNALTRLLRNLLENAVQAISDQGDIIVRAVKENGSCVLTVHDSGRGIPPEALSHLGERFFRADEARTRSGKGTGLGLAICRQIVKRHGGTMRFASAVGKGTLVTITLPE